MHNRGVRLILLVLFFAAMTTAAYLFWKAESEASAEAARAAAFDAAAQSAAHTLVELRASQRGYVAAGQGGDFWAQKVAQTVDTLRGATVSLRSEATAAPAQTAIERASSALDDFV